MYIYIFTLFIAHLMCRHQLMLWRAQSTLSLWSRVQLMMMVAVVVMTVLAGSVAWCRRRRGRWGWWQSVSTWHTGLPSEPSWPQPSSWHSSSCKVRVTAINTHKHSSSSSTTCVYICTCSTPLQYCKQNLPLQKIPVLYNIVLCVGVFSLSI